jgi:hypothetical protein
MRKGAALAASLRAAASDCNVAWRRGVAWRGRLARSRRARRDRLARLRFRDAPGRQHLRFFSSCRTPAVIFRSLLSCLKGKTNHSPAFRDLQASHAA